MNSIMKIQYTEVISQVLYNQWTWHKQL